MRRPFPETQALAPMMPQAVATAPEVGAAIARLMSGDVFTALAVAQADQRAPGLEAVLLAVVDDGTRVAWVGNPLRSPLTMVRFLLQIVGPEVDLRIERGPGDLARLMAHRVAGENRLLVVVQQPETIDPETIEQLGAMAGHLGSEAVQLQFLFVGSPELRLPQVTRAALRLIAVPEARFEAGDWTVGVASRRRPRLLWFALILLGVVAAGVTPAILFHPEAGPKTAASVPGPPSVNLGDTERLHQRFDTFLTERAASLPPLTDAQKDALFDEFLTYHRHD